MTRLRILPAARKGASVSAAHSVSCRVMWCVFPFLSAPLFFAVGRAHGQHIVGSTTVCCSQLVVLTRYQVILVMSSDNIRLIDQIYLWVPKMKLSYKT